MMGNFEKGVGWRVGMLMRYAQENGIIDIWGDKRSIG